MPAVRKATIHEGAEGGAITLTRLEDAMVEIRIVGLTPIIPGKWSEKAKMMMPGHPAAEALGRTKKGVRKPEEEAESRVYRLPDGRPGVPATAYKAAMVSACRFFARPTMTEAKLLFFVEGTGPNQLVPLEHEEPPILREDTTRNATGVADLRYRYAFYPWAATLRIRYTPSSISASSVAALLDAAGRVGVGEWRPGSPKSATGTYGTWRADAEG